MYFMPMFMMGISISSIPKEMIAWTKHFMPLYFSFLLFIWGKTVGFTIYLLYIFRARSQLVGYVLSLLMNYLILILCSLLFSFLFHMHACILVIPCSSFLLLWRLGPGLWDWTRDYNQVAYVLRERIKLSIVIGIWISQKGTAHWSYTLLGKQYLLWGLLDIQSKRFSSFNYVLCHWYGFCCSRFILMQVRSTYNYS